MSKLAILANHGVSLGDKCRAVVEEHFEAVKQKYTTLQLTINGSTVSIFGTLEFEAEYDGVSIVDSYEVVIEFHDDYPNIPPVAREVGGKIPDSFHKFENGVLCLGAPIEIVKQFNRQRNIIGFIDHLLIPYLFSYSHKLKYNYLPFGELAHGERGLLDNYKDQFGVFSDLDVLRLLKVLAEDNYRGHLYCPCGSQKKIRKCHGKVLLKLKSSKPVSFFFKEYFTFLLFLFPNVRDTPKELLSKKLLNDLKQI